MLESLEGVVTACAAPHLLLAVGPVTLHCLVSRTTAEQVPIRQRYLLFTHLAVSEDQWRLYAFATAAERNVFTLLISVSQVGPAAALQLLSSLSLDELHAALLHKDIAALRRARGIGQKTAERLVLELHSKLAQFPVPSGTGTAASPAPALRQEACQALVALGHTRPAAEEAVALAAAALSRPENLSELVKEALRLIKR